MAITLDGTNGIDLNGTELILDADADSSITADTDDTLHFKIAGTDHIQFDANGITVSDADNSQPRIILKTTDAGSGSPFLDFIKDSASPADNDNLMVLRNIGDNDAGETVAYVTLLGRSSDVTDGTENGSFQIETVVDGTNAHRIGVDSTGKFSVNDGKGTIEADSNGNVNITSIGGGGTAVQFTANGEKQAEAYTVGGTTANFVRLVGGQANGAVLIEGQGSDTNVGIQLNTKGSGGVHVNAALSKASGSFKIKHPVDSKKDSHYLVHSFTESPQADLIYRGKVNLVGGSATINIDTTVGMTDGTFVALNTDVQCFTTNESGWTAVKGSVSGNVLTLTAQANDCTDSISWMVVGERQDQHMKDTGWTDSDGKVILEPEQEADDVILSSEQYEASLGD